MVLEIDPAAPLWVRLAADTLRYLHIGGGAVGLMSGAAALVFRKGARAHRSAGAVFVASMLIMSGIGAAVAPFLPERLSILGGWMAFYLVATGWLTVWRPAGTAGRLEVVALLAAVGLVVLTAGLTRVAANDPSATVDGQPWQGLVLFGVVAPLAAIGDLRLLLSGGVTGARRLTRHLWRMCMALLIAATSYFLGQPDFLPGLIRGTGWVHVPPLAILLALVYWLVRVQWRQRAWAVSPRGTGRPPASGNRIPDTRSPRPGRAARGT